MEKEITVVSKEENSQPKKAVDNMLKIAKDTGFKKTEVELVAKQVLKGGTFGELQMYLSIARSLDLNPFNKEMWAYKDSKGNLIMFSSRDGFRKIAHNHKTFRSLNSIEVCEKDEFSMMIDDNSDVKVSHKIVSVKDRGAVIGAYAILKDERGTIIEYIDRVTYDKKYNVWASNPTEMCKKVAEAHAIKKMYSVSGLYVEDEIEVKDGKVVIDMPTTSNNADKLL